MREYEHYFLDPTGINLKNFLICIENALNSLQIWWEGNDPKISPQELAIKKEKLGKLLAIAGFSPPYKKIEPLLARILENIKFNQRNFVNIHPSPMLPAILASLIVSIQNPNNISREVSPATTKLEEECIQFYRELIGYPAESWGTLVSDGTLANLTALLVARDEKYYRNSSSKELLTGKEGLFSRDPGVILTTTNVHYSIEKAMWILGIGSRNLIKIPVAIDEVRLLNHQLWDDDRFEQFKAQNQGYSADELKDFYEGKQEPFSLRPNIRDFERELTNGTKIFALLLTAGTTQTATIENISEIMSLKNENDIYYHIDAAIGGYTFCIPEIRDKVKGIENADSITIDGHKLGFIHYPCGAIIFRKHRFKDLIEHTAPYLEYLSPTIEGSRPGTHAAACWLAHNTLTREGYRRIIGNLMNQTQVLRECLQEEGSFQIYHEVDLNAIVFGINRPDLPRKKINQWNLQIAERINKEGKFLVNLTQNLAEIKVRNIPTKKDTDLVDIQGIRVLIMNPFTDQEIIKAFIIELKKQMNRVIS